MNPEEVTFENLVNILEEVFGLRKNVIARMIGVKANTISENLSGKLFVTKNHKASRRLIKLFYVLLFLKSKGYENELIIESLSCPIINAPIGPSDSIISCIIQDRQIDIEFLAEKSEEAILNVIESKKRFYEEMNMPIKKIMHG